MLLYNKCYAGLITMRYASENNWYYNIADWKMRFQFIQEWAYELP